MKKSILLCVALVCLITMFTSCQNMSVLAHNYSTGSSYQITGVSEAGAPGSDDGDDGDWEGDDDDAQSGFWILNICNISWHQIWGTIVGN